MILSDVKILEEIKKGTILISTHEFKNKMQSCSNSQNYINGKKMKFGF